MNKSFNENKNDIRIERHERLKNLYTTLVQLIIHEGRFVSERTSNFLLFNSILFASFILISTQIKEVDILILSLKLLLSVVGFIICIFQYSIINSTIDAANFWRSSIRLIEEDPDYWYPNKEDGDKDLDIFKARRRYLDGIQTRQTKYPLKLSELPSITRKTSSFLAKPNSIFGFFLPTLIGIIWFFCFMISNIQLWLYVFNYLFYC